MTSLQKKLESTLHYGYTKNRTKSINSFEGGIFMKDLFKLYLEDEEKDEKIVKRKAIEMKPMNEEEALLQMDLLGHEFFVYKDMHTNKVCVLYRRKDGNYGLIETN